MFRLVALPEATVVVIWLLQLLACIIIQSLFFYFFLFYNYIHFIDKIKYRLQWPINLGYYYNDAV